MLLNPHLFTWFHLFSQKNLLYQIYFLKEENKILREHIPKKHLILNQSQINRLLRYGTPLAGNIKNIISIVHPSTWYKWRKKQFSPQTQPKKRGRPAAISTDIKNFIIQMVQLNHKWGYTKILAELKKLHIKISITSIRNILKEYGIDTFPKRSEDTWDQYLKRTFDSLWACDFFTKTVWTPLGLKFYYTLFFINVKTRRVYLVGTTTEPNKKWLLKNIKKANIQFNPYQRDVALIRDRDTKFTKDFDLFLENQGVTIIKTPFRSPNLNPYAESWVATIKRECLNHFFIFGKVHLEYLIEEFVKYYNTYRPHSSMNNEPLTKNEIKKTGEICKRSILSGLHHHYYRIDK